MRHPVYIVFCTLTTERVFCCGRCQIGGHVTVMYFVGGRNMSISEPLRLAADGMYHVVRFTRYGVNATLQLDDLPTQTRNYSGQCVRIVLPTLVRTRSPGHMKSVCQISD